MGVRQEIKPMLVLAWPVVVSELGWMAMVVVDTMMVGRISAEAIGAVSLGAAAVHAVSVFGVGLLLGLDPLVSQAWGARRIRDCHHFLVQALYISIVASPLLMGLVWSYAPLLELLGVDRQIEILARPYMDAINWSIFPLMLFTAFRRYLQGMGRVGWVMVVLVSANLINVAANWVFIFGNLGFTAMGATGAGWATFASRTYMFLALLVYVLVCESRLATGLKKITLSPAVDDIRRIINLGFPAAIQTALEVGVFAAGTTLIAKLGAIPLASHQIALNCAAVAFMVPLAISSAGAIRVGHALGRECPNEARSAGWAALLLGASFMGCAAVVFVMVPEPILRMFTVNTEVLAAGATLLYVAALFQLSDGLQVVATGVLRGAGETRIPMISTLFGHWALGLPIGYLLCFQWGWGASGIWVGWVVGLTTVAVVLLVTWHWKMGRKPHLATD
ncbi:MAG: MATE family efflux transporter [Solibacterales bacterium]|nr:MATE family efflux transporter [Bryobacterales bacterium]|tara:strand:+ start:2459 stop:3802 length:1344 start_codon:yes stop_codon:yes gene_type:complete